MARRRRTVALATCALLKFIALCTFARGFLLTRKASTSRAHYAYTDDSGGDVLVSKVVVLVIDGARHAWVREDAGARALAFTRALGRSRRIDDDDGVGGTDDAKGCGKMFKFVADAPTTTQQRLKGILTGGLPTFIDVSASFGGAALDEDNVVAQLLARGKRMAVSGDDTWGELFDLNVTFTVDASPFESFDVKDTTTVDAGVRRRMRDMLRRPDDWDVLIGHMLGADHVGHTYGATTDEMEDKLRENDQDVRDIVETLRADARFAETLFFVFGDHGMTDHGDHGGGTADETESFLLVYHPWASKCTESGKMPDETMPQVDFAPTLASLVGVPIPYGNLGTVNEKIFNIAHGGKPRDDDAFTAYSHAVFSNAEQIWTYINTYGDAERSSPFRAEDETRLRDVMHRMTRESNPTRKLTHALEFMKMTADIARAQWAEFGLWRMTIGFVALVGAVSANAFAAYALTYDDGDNAHTSTTLMKTTKDEANNEDYTIVATVGVVLVALASVSRLSNSYVVEERSMSQFLFATYVVALGIRAATFTRARIAQVSVHTILALFANVAMFKLGTNWIKSDASVSRDAGLGFAFVGCAGCLAFAYMSHRFVARRFPHTMPAVILVILAWFAVAARCVEVLVLGGDGFVAARMCYGASAAAAFAAFARAPSKAPEVETDTIVRRCALFVVVIVPTLTMLAGPALGVIYFGLMVITYGSTAALALGGDPLAATVRLRCRGLETTLATGAWLASTVVFFGGGHACSFDGLHFAAAFTGFKTFHFYVMGALLACETWSADILLAACAPMISAILYRGDKTQSTPSSVVVRVAQKITLVRTVPVLCSVLCAAAHRRHLMVWAIFAPKFVYDAIGSTVADVCAMTLVIFATRTPQASARAKVKAQ